MVMGLGYKRPAIVDYLCMTAGTCLMGIAIQSIYDPVGMVVGGFTGVAILIRQLTVKWIPGGIPLWFTNLALNLPVFLCAWRRKGKKFVWLGWCVFVAGIIWNGNAVFLASGTASLEYSPG